MKILVVSDTHNYIGNVLEAIDALKPDYTYHLGDVAGDCDEIQYAYPNINFNAVLGNNDFFNKRYEKELSFTLAGVKFFMCHGHKYNVKSGLELLKHRATELGANVVLFGHTHQKFYECFDGVHYINPGSARSTYALIEINNSKIDVKIKEFGDYNTNDADCTLNEDKLKSLINYTTIGNPLYFYDEVTSTFDVLKQKEFDHGTVIVAKKQTQGRGRLQRVWQSDEGGIYFSFCLDAKDIPFSPQIVSIICSLAVCDVLKKYGDAKIKWPNDIVLNGKKICGILSLANTENSEINKILVGIGINANNESFEKELIYASSLKLETGKVIDENILFSEIIKSIDTSLRHMDIENQLKKYKHHCITLNKEVIIKTPQGEVINKGLCTDILLDGSLEVICDGKKINVNSNEVSVRGLYGYIL